MRLIIESDEELSMEHRSSESSLSNAVPAPPEYQAVGAAGESHQLARTENAISGAIEAPVAYRPESAASRAGSSQSLADDQF